MKKFKSIFLFLSFLCLMISLTSCEEDLNLPNILPSIDSPTRDSVTIDVSQFTNKVEYEVKKNIASICFTGKAISSWNITIEERTAELDITFDNLSIYSLDSCVLTAANSDYELNLHINGNCTVSSKLDAINVQQMNIDGTPDSKLEVSAGDGTPGDKGIDGYSGANEGGNGGRGNNGKDGNAGYHAIKANILNLSDIFLKCIGGNGGKGGDGGNGGNGGTGKTYVHILYGGKDGQKNYGGKGGAGGNGGNGGAPGYGILPTCIIKNDGTARIVITNGIYGVGGKGGDGGQGGAGGNYYNSLGSVWQCAGGSGGNGGAGGNGSKPGSKGIGGAVGSKGTGASVNGVGLGINYGAVYYDGDNNPTKGEDGASGNSL